MEQNSASFSVFVLMGDEPLSKLWTLFYGKSTIYLIASSSERSGEDFYGANRKILNKI